MRRPFWLNINVLLTILSSSTIVIALQSVLSGSLEEWFAIIWCFIKVILQGLILHSNGHGHNDWIGTLSLPYSNTYCSFGELWAVSGVSVSRLDISGAVFTVLLLVANSLFSCSSSGLELTKFCFLPHLFFPFHHFNPLFTYSFLHFYYTYAWSFLSWLVFIFGCTDFISCFPSSLTNFFTSLLGLDLATFNLLLSCSWSGFCLATTLLARFSFPANFFGKLDCTDWSSCSKLRCFVWWS